MLTEPVNFVSSTHWACWRQTNQLKGTWISEYVKVQQRKTRKVKKVNSLTSLTQTNCVIHLDPEHITENDSHTFHLLDDFSYDSSFTYRFLHEYCQRMFVCSLIKDCECLIFFFFSSAPNRNTTSIPKNKELGRCEVYLWKNQTHDICGLWFHPENTKVLFHTNCPPNVTHTTLSRTDFQLKNTQQLYVFSLICNCIEKNNE